MKYHYRSTSTSHVGWRDDNDAPLVRCRPLLLNPRRAVEREPLILLSEDTLTMLYNEQKHKTSKEAKRRTTHRQTATGRRTRKPRRDRPEPQDEPRVSDSSSHPRTSTSSSLAPPTPHPIDQDEEAIARVYAHSIVLDSAVADMQRRATQPLPQRDCQVCYERMDGSDTQTCPTCRGVFCANCVRWYIEHKILEGHVSEKKLVCPGPRCMRPLTKDYIQKAVSSSTFEKYLQFRENQRPGIRFCPRPGCCAKLQEPLHTTSRRAWCASCGNESCMKCGEGFHLLPTCHRKEKRYGKWREHSDVRHCPSCKSDIEKQGGCAHMRCFQCDAEFCWSCLRPWYNHDETLCIPLSFLKSKDPKFGGCKPVRAVTKTIILGAAVVVGATGASVAAIVLPPVLLARWIRSSTKFSRRDSLPSDSFIIE